MIADVRLPGMSGVELQDALRERGTLLPFVIITAHGDVATARAAFRSQAVDFLEKPFDNVQLFAAIETAFALEERRIQRHDSRRADAQKLSRLTAREREVLEQAALGLHAKEIAAALGISPRTVEVHKTRIMEKLGVRNVGELVRLAIAAKPPDGILISRGELHRAATIPARWTWFPPQNASSHGMLSRVAELIMPTMLQVCGKFPQSSSVAGSMCSKQPGAGYDARRWHQIAHALPRGVPTQPTRRCTRTCIR